MRIISLSVDGIHQAAQRGLYDWIAKQDADIICLQDLRAYEYELDHSTFHPEGYNAYFFDSGIKHFNGVAIYSRQLPKALIYGFGFSSGIDMQGRYLQIDFEHLSVGSFLAPMAAADDDAAMETKVKFFDDLQAHLHKITRKRRDFIFCGNWSMASNRQDVQNWANHENEDGFLPHQQLWMRQLFTELGYTDAFRQVNSDTDEYTYWPSGIIGKGDAMRVDFQVISNSLASSVEYAVVYKSQVFSGHLPVIVDYDIEL